MFGLEPRRSQSPDFLTGLLKNRSLEDDFTRRALSRPLSICTPMNSNNPPSPMASSEDRG